MPVIMSDQYTFHNHESNLNVFAYQFFDHEEFIGKIELVPHSASTLIKIWSCICYLIAKYQKFLREILQKNALVPRARY